ncbi:MAG TPA: SIS domain-containing protein [Streptosporangiaceae bacterium]|nr:SIS domain-containing protein [Streptosporangiaceae bacterium]
MTGPSEGQPAGGPAQAGGPAANVAAAFARRSGPGRELADSAEQIASAAHAMALRFHQGGKLVVFGTGAASTDAQHVAVEFVHPVIVGKRALPAISLTSDAATVTAVAAREGLENAFAHQIRYLAEPADIALGIAPDGSCPSVIRGLLAAGELGMLTVALTGGQRDALAAGSRLDFVLAVGSADPRIIKEIHVSTYHVLWELVHVFFEQPGVLGPGVVT